MDSSGSAQWLWEGCVMERRERRHHTREFKLEAVRLAGLGDKTKAKVARELGIRVTMLGADHPDTATLRELVASLSG